VVGDENCGFASVEEGLELFKIVQGIVHRKSSTWQAMLGWVFHLHHPVVPRCEHFSSFVDGMDYVFEVVPRIDFVQFAAFYNRK
jgi:hypothetical protein